MSKGDNREICNKNSDKACRVVELKEKGKIFDWYVIKI
jgi:uncharacterized OB-fold protein